MPMLASVLVTSMQNSITAAQLKLVLQGDVDMIDCLSNTIKQSSDSFKDFIHLPEYFGFNEQVFRFMAENYRLYGDSFRDMCTHNAQVSLYTYIFQCFLSH